MEHKIDSEDASSVVKLLKSASSLGSRQFLQNDL